MQPIFNARNAICLATLVVVMSAANWAFGLLSRSVEFSSFAVIMLLVIAGIIGLSFFVDYCDARSRNQKRQ